VIAESSAVGVDTEKVIQSSGYAELRDMGYEVINLKKTPWVNLPAENGVVFKELQCWEVVKQADVIISVPKENRTERHVDGCPPNNAYVVQAIIGGRTEVKRMYADESLDKTNI